MELKRTFHAVGQGAFYSERFYEGEKNVFNVVYDCGTKNRQGDLRDAVCAEFSPETSIDYLFISHFHIDHISGVEFLKNHCKVEKMVIPCLSPQMIAESALHSYFWVRATNNNEARFLGYLELVRSIIVSQPMQLDEQYVLPINEENSNWIYIPYNTHTYPNDDIIQKLRNNGLDSLATAFENFFNNHSEQDAAIIYKLIRQADVEVLKQAYSEVFGDNNHHYYVMPVYSGYNNIPCCQKEEICLYTGDYDAGDNTKVSALKNPIANRWDTVGTLQVPHHGSKYNSCRELFLDSDKLYVISSYGRSVYKHPHMETIELISNQGSKLILVGQPPTTSSCILKYSI